jgi:hypothetical protein
MDSAKAILKRRIAPIGEDVSRLEIPVDWEILKPAIDKCLTHSGECHVEQWLSGMNVIAVAFDTAPPSVCLMTKIAAAFAMIALLLDEAKTEGEQDEQHAEETLRKLKDILAGLSKGGKTDAV